MNSKIYQELKEEATQNSNLILSQEADPDTGKTTVVIMSQNSDAVWTVGHNGEGYFFTNGLFSPKIFTIDLQQALSFAFQYGRVYR